MRKVTAVLGDRCAAELWVAGQPAIEHPVARALPNIRVVDAYLGTSRG